MSIFVPSITVDVFSTDPVTGIPAESTIFQISVDDVTLAADLANFEPNSSTSPDAGTCRKYTRAMFLAYLAADPTKSHLG